MIKYLFVFAFGYLTGSVGCHAQTNPPAVTQYLNQYGQPVGSVVPNGASQVVLNQYGQPVGFIITPVPITTSLPVPPVQPILPVLPILGVK